MHEGTISAWSSMLMKFGSGCDIIVGNSFRQTGYLGTGKGTIIPSKNFAEARCMHSRHPLQTSKHETLHELCEWPIVEKSPLSQVVSSYICETQKYYEFMRLE